MSALRWLGAAAGVGVLAALYLGLVAAPRDAVQGEVSRILYLHVPSVLTAYLAFAVVFVFSIAYLKTRSFRWDAVARSSAELGVIFTGITIVSGSIWGKPTWGAWWTWDARLTSVSILFVIYVGYLMLRGFADDEASGARYAAVLGIIGALDIPVIHMAVVWWRTLHQPATLLGAGPSKMAPEMKAIVLANIAIMWLLYAYLLAVRVRLEGVRRAVLEMKLQRGRR
ncbi:MAG TPA: cytochrome c biogenesis protein CcsA [Candidatus Sulfotelmatobacter sp.]|nr:cytochrome c biogenesis protein CcsA [Candidatus Sulfotelmatobacter sp.]